MKKRKLTGFIKSAPIIVLLAMNPATLNSDIPNKYMPLNAQELTEVVAQTPTNNISTLNLSAVQAPEDAEYPLGWAYLRGKAIKEVIPTVGGGRKANLVLSGTRDTKDVYKVYYIDAKMKDGNLYHRPPEVHSLIYHDLGEENGFLGIKLQDYLYHDKNEPNKLTGYMYREMPLDDKSAQYLIDLLTNDTKWNNKTDITYSETTSPKLMVPEVY